MAGEVVTRRIIPMMRRGTRCVVLWTTRGFCSPELWLTPTFLDWLLRAYPHVIAVECG
jgi:hypothetical protein